MAFVTSFFKTFLWNFAVCLFTMYFYWNGDTDPLTLITSFLMLYIFFFIPVWFFVLIIELLPIRKVEQ